MSRYIDADALMQDVIAHSYPLTNAFSVGGVDDGMFVTGIQQVVDEQPTVDAVPVVRCGECKWAEVDAWWTYCKLGHKEDTTNSIIYTCTHDFYCADGERRSDGE